MSSSVPIGALLTAALLTVPPDVSGRERTVKVVSGRLVTCAVEDASDRRCLTLRVHISTIRDSKNPRRESITLIADERLVDRVYDIFDGLAPEVFDAMVSAFGHVLRQRGSIPRAAAVRALDILDEAEVLRYYAMKDGVSLSADIEARVAQIAARYFRATGRTLLVTSGTRGPHKQARAMYGKLIAGSNLNRIYGKKGAIQAIIAAYRSGRRAKLDREQVIAAMAQVIEAQCEEGVFVSKHLVAGAVDIRSYDMSRAQKASFRQAVRAQPGVSVLQERRPPHFHLSFD